MEYNNDLTKNEIVTILMPFSERLLELAHLTNQKKDKGQWLTTLYLGKILSYSSRLEELLDYCGAKRNKSWFPFRESVAAIKLFSNVTYIFIHIRSTCPLYNLVGDIEDLLTDTDKAIQHTSEALFYSLNELLKLGKSLGLKPSEEYGEISFSLSLPKGKLIADRKKVEVQDAETVIVNMATSFLNLFTDTEILDLCKNGKCNYVDYVPNPINEMSLRNLEMQFHNLQSLYDTHVSNTSVESLDTNLPIIRGHASIVYHLLEAATELVHYYERHMSNGREQWSKFKPPIKKETILGILFGYNLSYTKKFLAKSISLCREVIASYAEEGIVEVPVPSYRGFHVRPSTLVAKIVQHYGSNVSLKIGEMECNANLPLELFRVNEKINAEKRKSISQVLGELDALKSPKDPENIHSILNSVFRELIQKQRIVIYNLTLDFPDLKKLEEESLPEYINRIIASMLAEAKIDIQTDLKVNFQGDKRVLHDLELLAKNGYGEDNFGNNIILPKELSYLKR